MGSFIAAHGVLSSCGVGSVVAAYGLSCPAACGILVTQSGIEPTPPALEGRFLTTGPPGKPQPQEHGLLFLILAMLWGMEDLSSLTRD